MFIVRILLLEDEEQIGELYVRALSKEKFDVKWVKNTLETEKLAKTGSFDVVLLDHGIKGEGRSGMDLIPTLKELLPKSKIIVLSNYNLFQLKEKGDESVYYYLKIDTPPSVLIKRIHQLLNE